MAPGEEGKTPEEAQEPRAGGPERQSARKKQPPSRYPDKAKRR